MRKIGGQRCKQKQIFDIDRGKGSRRMHFVESFAGVGALRFSKKPEPPPLEPVQRNREGKKYLATTGAYLHENVGNRFARGREGFAPRYRSCAHVKRSD